MNSADTLSIICSFLQPIELCRLRAVGKYYTPIVDQWLMKSYHRICIEEWACPQCGDLLEENEITYTSFYDVMYGDIDRIERSRYQYISDFSKYTKNVRVQLLCDQCENEEKFDPKAGDVRFRFQGNRSYQLVVIRTNVLPWAFLVYRIRDELYWNECRAIISPILPNYEYYKYYDEDDEDMVGDDEDMVEDDEDEDW
jgi:hypothetical protein